MQSLLKGLKVLDLTQALAGPFCTLMLADLGAEVIKVEVPQKGDDTRGWGPYVKGESAYFMCVNRGKKSITLDLKKPKGREILLKLATSSDVFIENFRPGVMKRLGVDYETLKHVNPRIIYCSVSGFGQSGPYAQKPAYDLVLQGMGGVMSVTGEPEGAPVKVGVPIADIGASMFASSGILAGLHNRDRTGEGQYLDVSMLDCQLAWLSFLAAGYFVSGEAPTRMGSAHHFIVPYQAFRTQDVYINIAVGTEGQWENFCKAIEREDLFDNPKFKTNHERLKNRAVLIPELEKTLLTRIGAEWLRALEKYAIPSGPIVDIGQILNDPQTLHRRMIIEAKHPVAGKTRMTGIPIKFSEGEAGPPLGAPTLGQHNSELLSSIGYGADEIRQLQKEGVV